MAELRDRIDITVEELEESLGAVRLPRFIAESEKNFVGRIDSICDEICSDTNKRAIFVSGPTSSGKTTFTLRLSKMINSRGSIIEEKEISVGDINSTTANPREVFTDAVRRSADSFILEINNGDEWTSRKLTSTLYEALLRLV